MRKIIIGIATAFILLGLGVIKRTLLSENAVKTSESETIVSTSPSENTARTSASQTSELNAVKSYGFYNDVTNPYKEYINELLVMDTELSDNISYNSEHTATLRAIEAWEKELDKIYDLFLKSLQPDEMEAFTAEQQTWGENMMNKIAPISSTSGMTSTLLNGTRARTLELVSRYFENDPQGYEEYIAGLQYLDEYKDERMLQLEKLAYLDAIHTWAQETDKIFNLLLEKLPPDEIDRFKAEQHQWTESLNGLAESSELLNLSTMLSDTRSRTLRLVHMYVNHESGTRLALDAYSAILRNESVFCLTDSPVPPEDIYLNDYLNGSIAGNFEETYSLMEFAPADFDGNGYPELVLKTSHKILVFNYEDGTVYCHSYYNINNHSEMTRIKRDGSFYDEENRLFKKINKFQGVAEIVIDTISMPDQGTGLIDPAKEQDDKAGLEWLGSAEINAGNAADLSGRLEAVFNRNRNN